MCTVVRIVGTVVPDPGIVVGTVVGIVVPVPGNVVGTFVDPVACAPGTRCWNALLVMWWV